MGSSIFAAMRWLKFKSTTRYSVSIMPSMEIRTEKIISVDCGSYYRTCPSSKLPIKPGEFSLATSCGCHSMGFPVWRQRWHQPEFHIGPGWGRHISFPTRLSPDLPPPLIYCGPGVLWVHRLNIKRIRILVQGIEALPAPHYYVQWQSLRVFS